MKHPEYMPIPRIVKELGPSEYTIRKWIKQGLVEASRPPDCCILVSVTSARAMIKQHAIPSDIDNILKKIGLAA